LLFVEGQPRDPTLIALEKQIRKGIRDALNRSSRKPFRWGGLTGYQQLTALAQELRQTAASGLANDYLQQLLDQVERAVRNNRTLAEDVGAAYTWTQRIAACLRYPTTAQQEPERPSGQQVADEMNILMQQFHPDLKRRPAQTALYRAWQRLWRTWGPELLHCYDIPGLPADNLRLEALFGRLRRHQRRISGRKTTHELREFGQCQVLFQAETEQELLEQLRSVGLADYQAQRRKLAEAEAPRQFLRRLHHDPVKTVRQLLDDHAARQSELGRAATAGVHNT
jgi:hypothetical protein